MHMLRTGLIPHLALGLVLVFAPQAARAANISLSFDAGAQGVVPSSGGLMQFEAGGFLSQKDIDGQDMLLHLPVALLGDWSGFLGGTLSFDAINLNGAATDWLDFGRVTITGAAGSASLDIVAAPAPASTWTTYTTTLDAATWGPGLAAILAQVSDVSIKLESHIGFDGAEGFELNGFDNLKVTAVPEPQSTALMLAGLGTVAVLAARRRSKA